MQGTIGQTTYGSLTEMVKQSKQQDAGLAEALKKSGTKAIDKAVEFFYQDVRDKTEAKAVLSDLSDLKEAMMACYDQTLARRADATKKAEARLTHLKNHGLQTGELQEASDKRLTNAERIAGPGMKLEGPKVIKDGRRTFTDEVPQLSYKDRPDDPMTGLSKFIVDLHNLIGLYACSTLIPGPIGLTVGNFAKEQMDGSSSSDSYNASSFSARSLLHSAAGSSVTAMPEQGAVHYDKTSTDERVIPALLDLRDRLQQIRIRRETTSGSIYANRDMVEYKTNWAGHDKALKQVNSSSSYWKYSSINFTRTVESFSYGSDHVWLPSTGVSAYRAK